MVKNKKEIPENEEPKKKKIKKKKKKEKIEDFGKTMKDIKEYITDAAKPYAKYINKLEDNFEGNLFVDNAETKSPKNSYNKKRAINTVNIPLSLFSEIIIELSRDLIPDIEKEDIFVALDNLFIQIDLVKKSIVLVNNHGL